MTALYCACSADTVEQCTPSSVPAAPPKETMTSPPAARNALTGLFQKPPVTEVSPLNVALHPPPLASMTNARVKYFSPVAVWTEDIRLVEAMLVSM